MREAAGKHLALTIAAAAAIAQVGISAGKEVGALAVVILLGYFSILAPTCDLLCAR